MAMTKDKSMTTSIIQQITKTALLGIFAVSLPLQAQIQTIDSIAAVVDDGIIMESELEQRIDTIKRQSQGMRLPPDDILQDQVLERLIIENLQLQMAERSGMRISDEQLNQTIINIAKQNGLTLREFKKALEKDGVSYAQAREQIRRERIISEVQRYRVGSKINISEQDVDNFLNSVRGKSATAEEYRLGHILIQVPSQASRAQLKRAQNKAEDIVKKLRNGADFQQMAISQSEGRNALKGGDLGWRKEAELPTLFADIVPDLKKGQVSNPIRSASGYHIIKISDKRGGDTQMVRQTKARHILIQENEIRNSQQAKKLINDLYKKLKNGADFDELAKEYSDDPGSKLSGGDLGWVNQGDMVPAFEQTMNATKKGQISEPFKSRFGWHVLQVTDYRQKDVGEEIQRNQARQLLYSRRFEEELPIWLRQIRADAYVEVK
ncbi:Parvulin-like peptidyl-prolyl isomerase [Oceanobacter sp. RED65]|uniref:Chaperone SurA n=2 Tax=Bermanella marisrubri TaxID=207949 RepID=Q1N3R7_9GAMM|nr:Parvulin-like peptidyl-prolyl isomerase [Oceanobacter sp. RED65] [Bermanella marisrubri]